MIYRFWVKYRDGKEETDLIKINESKGENHRDAWSKAAHIFTERGHLLRMSLIEEEEEKQC